MSWLIFAAAAARAQSADAGSPEEVVVWGQLARDLALDALVHRMEDLGWRLVDRDPDEIVFRAPEAWNGRATFHTDGSWSFRRPIAGLRAMPPETYAAKPFPDGMEVGAGPSLWLFPSARKVEIVRDRLVDALQPEVDTYLTVARRTELENQLSLLPDRLDALWTDGSPLDGSPGRIDGADARRRVVLAYWASRTDTAEGQRVAEAVETWLAATVQGGDHPITDAERGEFVRADGRTLP